MDNNFLKEIILKSDEGNIILTNHARVRMFERNISTQMIKTLISSAEIIEEYPEDQPCPSALLLISDEMDIYHAVVGNCEDHVRIITIYRPDEEVWENSRRRKK